MRTLFLVLLALATLGCGYDPPPMIESSSPIIGGTAGVDVVIRVEFSEEVEPGTLEVRLAGRKLDNEGELLPFCAAGDSKDCAPLLAGPCSPGTGGCSGASLDLSAGGTILVVEPDEDLPIGDHVLRISEGLRDKEGNQTGVPYDVHFFVSPLGTAGPTTFEPGVFITWMELDKPFYFPIDVYWHIQVDPDTGRIFGGACDGDLIDPDGEKIYDHTVWKPVATLETEGYKLVFDGQVQDAQVQDEEGNLVDGWLLATNPFYIYAGQPQVEVMDGRMTVSIYEDPEMGRQVARGTMISDETYIFDTPAHEHPHEASGVVFGYRLIGDEIGTDATWQLCADPDPDTITLP